MDTKKLDWEKLAVGQEVGIACGPYGGTGKVVRITPDCIEVRWSLNPVELAWREHNERRGWTYEYGDGISRFDKNGRGLVESGIWEMGGTPPYVLEGSPAAAKAARQVELEKHAEEFHQIIDKEFWDESTRLGHFPKTPEEKEAFRKRLLTKHPELTEYMENAII